MPIEKKKVLIVDDEDTVTKALGMLLEDDYDVTLFTTHECGKNTLKWLEEGNIPDYAILDILINGVSGVDIANSLLKKSAFTTPIMFITGCANGSPEYNKAKTMAETFKSNINFCEKPYDENGVKYSKRIKDDLIRAFTEEKK
jgi:response regulator RpfG family c-di-GMP phosphodiesterase